MKGLSRLMANRGGARTDKRRLLAAVSTSIMLYGAPLWADKLSDRSWDVLERVQRQAALRVCSAYRTVGKEAAFVIGKIVPLRIAARRDAAVYHGMDRRMARHAALEAWQGRCTTANSGSHTRKFIPVIQKRLFSAKRQIFT